MVKFWLYRFFSLFDSSSQRYTRTRQLQKSCWWFNVFRIVSHPLGLDFNVTMLLTLPGGQLTLSLGVSFRHCVKVSRWQEEAYRLASFYEYGHVLDAPLIGDFTV